MKYESFEKKALDDCHSVWFGHLPDALIPSVDQFDALWKLHKDAFPEILIHGRLVPIPRWQQAYGVDYEFSQSVSRALPVSDLLLPFLVWSGELLIQVLMDCC